MAMPHPPAGPDLRTFVPSCEARPGLESGDVVVLTAQGRPYIVIQAELPYKQDAVHLCLELAPDEEQQPRGLAFLEVVKQVRRRRGQRQRSDSIDVCIGYRRRMATACWWPWPAGYDPCIKCRQDGFHSYSCGLCGEQWLQSILIAARLHR